MFLQANLLAFKTWQAHLSPETHKEREKSKSCPLATHGGARCIPLFPAQADLCEFL